MSIAFAEIRVGNPIRHGALSVFPMYSDTSSQIDYELSDEALRTEKLIIKEVDESGSVPDLLVENLGDKRVLFIEGEELLGAKQNRILNTSVLVAAHSQLSIPVSCVEQGRWGYQSRFFRSSGSHSPSKLRRKLKASVARAIKQKRGHRSDQNEVWEEVAAIHSAYAVESDTAAMSDAFDKYKRQIANFRDQLQYVAGASGVAVAIGNKVVAIDIFDKPETCRKVWDRLLSGVVFDALEVGEVENFATSEDVKQLLAKTEAFSWEAAEAVGEGEELRAESPDGDHASALQCDGVVVHESVVAAV